MTDTPSSIPRVTVSRCMEVVSKAFGVSTRELAGQSRAQPLARQRQIAMWLARRATRDGNAGNVAHALSLSSMHSSSGGSIANGKAACCASFAPA